MRRNRACKSDAAPPRFVFLQQKVAEYAVTFIDFPPMQRGASFNLETVKAEIEEQVKAMKAKME